MCYFLIDTFDESDFLVQGDLVL